MTVEQVVGPDKVLDAGKLVDQLAPGIDNAVRHGMIMAILSGWDPRTPADIEAWLSRTGARALQIP